MIDLPDANERKTFPTYDFWNQKSIARICDELLNIDAKYPGLLSQRKNCDSIHLGKTTIAIDNRFLNIYFGHKPKRMCKIPHNHIDSISINNSALLINNALAVKY